MRGIALGLGILIMGAGMTQAEELPDFNKLWDFQDVAKTEVKFRELLPQAEASGDVSYQLQLLTQIARALGMQRKFDEAHKILDDIEKKLTGDLEVARIRYLLERGRVYNSSGSPEKSKPLFLDAWKLARDCGADAYAIDAAHMMGIVEPPEKQLGWSIKAMELAEKSKDERARRWLGPLYHNTAMTHLDLGEYEKALAIFQKDWEYRKPAGNQTEIRIAKWSVAHTLRKLERVDDALQMQRELEKEYESDGEPSGFVFEEIAECLLEQGMREQAQPYFRKAHELLKDVDWIKESDPQRLERLKELGGS